jgi:predicted  nucleic acid-binding Zn-ribbon protein
LCNGPKSCPSAGLVTCRECGEQWKISDEVRACPSCGVRKYRREPCDGCPSILLDAAMESGAGHMLRRALSLRDAPIKPTWDEITAEEYVVLQCIDAVVKRREKELAKKP